jgi:hypothetical protein
VEVAQKRRMRFPGAGAARPERGFPEKFSEILGGLTEIYFFAFTFASACPLK